eukprot:s27_g4.t1
MIEDETQLFQAKSLKLVFQVHGRTEGLVQPDTVDTPRSAVNAIGLGSAVREKGEAVAWPDMPDKQLPIAEPNDPAAVVPSQPFPELVDPADVDMELPPAVSSAPAEAVSFSEGSAPEFAQEDVAMDLDEPTEQREPMDIAMIDVCQCSAQIRIGCLTSPDLLFQERLSVESISFSGGTHSFEEVMLRGECVRLRKPAEPSLIRRLKSWTHKELSFQGLDKGESWQSDEGEGSLGLLQEAWHQGDHLSVGYQP